MEQANELERLALRNNRTGQGLIVTNLALLALGVVMVHSAVASVASPGRWYARVDVRHTIFAALAAMVLLTAWRFDYTHLATSFDELWRAAIRRLRPGRRASSRTPRRRSLLSRAVRAAGGRCPFAAGAALLVALLLGAIVLVPGLGWAKGGYLRWIRLGPREYSIGFQPSELIKLSLVVFLAAWLSRESVNVRSFRQAFLPAVLLTGLCVGLVVTQDLGMGAIIGLSAAVTLLLAGVPLYYLLSLLPLAAGAFYLFVMRCPHRWLRIQAMIDPWSPDNPCAYQARQSLLAIITGGWRGKGVGGGMLKLGFLPEDSTDFIFSVFCEEWGFVGALLLMGLVVMWMWHARRAATRAGDRFGSLLAGSLGFVIAVQAVTHIAVDAVAAPPTGMGMPFVSAGGTALMLHAAAAAMIVSVTAGSAARGRSPAAPRQREATAIRSSPLSDSPSPVVPQTKTPRTPLPTSRRA